MTHCQPLTNVDQDSSIMQTAAFNLAFAGQVAALDLAAQNILGLTSPTSTRGKDFHAAAARMAASTITFLDAIEAAIDTANVDELEEAVPLVADWLADLDSVGTLADEFCD